ncbi:MAG: Hsp70 family protein [Proteobacteria bacterium]|nr:Hsp70 family protein [Pseudomonadota bacterium]
MGVAVGIDLGTTNSCMAVVQANRAKVVVDQAERRIHPSVVSFHPDGSILAGHAAKERQIIDSENTIYSFKRLLGRNLSTSEMQRVLKDLPYKVRVSHDEIPALCAGGREISLPEVSAMLLRYMRELCYERLGVEVDEAVITVPANFNDVQRSSTKVAGRIAGFNVLRILNEPTAAALAYGFGGELTERIAIYDFGGGTFDITIVELADDIFEVLSTAGNTYLGGDDFDKKIVDEMQANFLKEYNYDLAGNPIAWQRIRSVAEKVKCQLSSIKEVQATLREIVEDYDGSSLDFHFKLTRQKFETFIEPFVAESLRVCDEAFKLAGVDRSSLDSLVLVGGTTRIPLVRQRVAEYFGMKPKTEINADEVVAIGAAIHAFSLTGEQLPEELPTPKPVEKKETRVSQSDAAVSKKPPAIPGLPPISKPAGTVAYGAPKPFPLGPEPQNEPTSVVQRTLHGMPDAKRKGSTLTPAPVQTPAPPTEPGLLAGDEELGLDVKHSGSAVDPSELEIDVKQPKPKTRRTDQYGAETTDVEPADTSALEIDVKKPKPGAEKTEKFGADAADLGIDIKKKEPLESQPDQNGIEAVDLGVDVKKPPPLRQKTEKFGAGATDLGIDVKKKQSSEPQVEQYGADPVDIEAMAGKTEPLVHQIDPFGADAGDSDSDAMDLEPLTPPLPAPLDREVSDEMPAVLGPLPPLEESVAFDDVEIGFGVLQDMPMPGAEQDEVVGLPPPVEQSEEEAVPDPVPPTEERMSIPVPATTARSALLLDVTPRALGVATAGGFCDTIIERNAAIPVEQSRLFNTSTDNQTDVSIDVYQGESRRITDNTQLGQVLLTNLRPAPRGEIKIRVTFEIDTDGILGVSARNQESGEAQSTRISLTGGMDDEQVEELVQKYAEK